MLARATRARARDRGPAGDRRVAPPHRPAAAVREPAARGARRAPAACSSRVAQRLSRRVPQHRRRARCSSISRSTGACFALHGRAGGGGVPALRPRRRRCARPRTPPASAMKRAPRRRRDSRERFGAAPRSWWSCRWRCRSCWSSARCSSSAAFATCTSLDPGFRQDGVLVATLDLRTADIARGSRAAALCALVERLRAIPGVDGAAEAFIAPVSGSWLEQPRSSIDGKTAGEDDRRTSTASAPATSRRWARRCVAGRDFTTRDTPRLAARSRSSTEPFVQKLLRRRATRSGRRSRSRSRRREPRPHLSDRRRRSRTRSTPTCASRSRRSRYLAATPGA